MPVCNSVFVITLSTASDGKQNYLILHLDHLYILLCIFVTVLFQHVLIFLIYINYRTVVSLSLFFYSYRQLTAVVINLLFPKEGKLCSGQHVYMSPPYLNGEWPFWCYFLYYIYSIVFFILVWSERQSCLNHCQCDWAAVMCMCIAVMLWMHWDWSAIVAEECCCHTSTSLRNCLTMHHLRNSCGFGGRGHFALWQTTISQWRYIYIWPRNWSSVSVYESRQCVYICNCTVKNADIFFVKK